MRTRIVLWEETKRECETQKQIKEERERIDEILGAAIF